MSKPSEKQIRAREINFTLAQFSNLSRFLNRTGQPSIAVKVDELRKIYLERVRPKSVD